MLLHCFNNGSLFLPVLWKGNTPLAALAILIDPQKRAMHCFIGARDEAFRGSPPGFMLHAYSIRHAIREGFASYDFMRGDEPYKYLFGATDRRTKHVIVATHNGQNLGARLDPRCLPTAFRLVGELEGLGQIAEARTGLQQILDVEPCNEKALWALGQLESAAGDHDAAVRALESLVALAPKAHESWMKLGDSLSALGRTKAAVESYREVIKRQPEFSAYKNLGDALLQSGRIEEAFAAFEAALDQHQGRSDADKSWADTIVKFKSPLPRNLARLAISITSLGDKFRAFGANAFAIDCYHRAIELEPNTITARYGLELALQGLRDVGASALSDGRAIVRPGGDRTSPGGRQ